MAQSRRELIDALVDDVTRTALGSAELGPEDRVVARQRVEKAIQRAAESAHGDVVALAHGDSHSPEADRFSAHMNNNYQEHGGPGPAAGDSAGRLAAELVASDDRTNAFHPLLRDRAEAYIANSITAAAVGEAHKGSHGPSQAPAAAAGAAAGPAGPGGAVVAAGLVVPPAGVVKGGGPNPAERRRPPSIG
ncbi:hypothetical protein OHA18_10085 [Kribbella sp. NBC_00709]|uniref:hypothetical protein n=1 Tax=Kribbella sp. NBC_00709 TaxID=2975972 RepID=UPI002E2B45FB|nr:hypothetical protein [Kribbella sp. NBC_00709]